MFDGAQRISSTHAGNPLHARLTTPWFRVAITGVVTLLGVVTSIAFVVRPQSITEYVVWPCAGLSFLSSLVAAGRKRARNAVAGAVTVSTRTARVAWMMALLSGVTAATVLTVVLGVRLLYAAVQWVCVLPLTDVRDYGFGWQGLGGLGLLFLACSVALASVKEPRLATGLWFIVLLTGAWLSLMGPVFEITAAHGLRRTGTSLALTSWLAVVLFLAPSVSAVLEQRRRWRLAWDKPDELVLPTRHWPGLHGLCGTVAVVLLLLCGYHLAVPIAIGDRGVRVAIVVVTLSAAVGSWGCFTLVSGVWSTGLADAGMGLMTLAIAGLAAALTPSYPELMVDRYPVILTALMVGLAMAVGLCVWLAGFWRQQIYEGDAWTTAGRLIPHAQRGAFLSAVLGVALAGLIAVWPRLSSIPTPDSSLGRVTAGFGANLLLLLVLLWSARRLRRPTFHILTVLALLTTVGFMVIRMLPFTPRFG